MRTSHYLALSLLLLLAGLAVVFYRPIAVGLLAAVRNPACTFSEAIRGYYGNRARERQIDPHLEDHLRLERQDPLGYELWETPRGSIWLPADSASMVVWLLKEMQRKIYGEGEDGVQPGDIVLDCGAHVGLYTKDALSAGARLVVAIEPAPENIECFRRNLSDEIAAGRVILLEKGVWDKEDILTLHSVPGFSAADSFVTGGHAGGDVSRVPLTTIDRLVSDLQLKRVDFIKMNIEGAEQKALAGARLTLSRFRPRLAVSAIHLEDDTEKIPQLVQQAWSGYRKKCGACYVDQELFLILPEVLLFN